MDITPQTVLDFWYDPATEPFWFAKSDEFDRTIQTRFADIHRQAAQGGLSAWRTGMDGRLAEIIVLDQFSRNLFRDSPQAFATDGMALVLAQEAAARPEFAGLPATHRHFMLLPLMHSESRLIHEQAMDLFARYAPHALSFEEQHKAIVDRFGRYPHRNRVLGRDSTPEELEFLKQEGSSF